MKIEISLKDLILFALVLLFLMVVVVGYTGLRKEIQITQKINQINQNSVNIQHLDKAIGQMRQQNAPTYELTPKEKKGGK